MSRQFTESLGRIAQIDSAAVWAQPDPAGGSILSVARQQGVADEHIQRALADIADIPVAAHLSTLPASARFVEQIPIAFARQHAMLGLAGGNGNLTVAVADLEDWTPLDVVGRY